ncbi:MAG: hypothetical protein D3923_01875 [Candidatus Electrothrix sp. AR3]|nr:hypothetical protein [Candidatus Electrothrix sp. AR3]
MRQRKDFTRFQLNVGRRNGIMPENLISRINEAPGGGRIKVGKIEIMRNTAMLEGDSRFISQILHAFQQFKINGKPVTIKVAPSTHNGRGRGGNHSNSSRYGNRQSNK